MDVDSQFWRGKRVFVTGHTGFKGAWLSLWLQQLGAQVTGYSLAPASPSLFAVAGVGLGMHSIVGDIRDGGHLSGALQAARPQIVLHLAAQALVRASYEDPVETYSTNVMGLIQLLEAVRQVRGIRAVVNVTSDKCYENREWLWAYREHDALGGYDPYSNSKACAELVSSAYRNSYFHPADYAGHGVALATARAGNVIGGGDWALDRLIPDILRAIGLGEPVRLRNLAAIRPWQHVLEPLRGYLMLAERLCHDGPAFAEAWNFGPAASDARPVEWVAQTLISLCGADASALVNDPSPQHEAHSLQLDSAKAAALLGWQPRWSLATALEQIAAWHQADRSGQDMAAVTLAQIQIYAQR
jgi:CDP-glucose 4,6-dehydratase